MTGQSSGKMAEKLGIAYQTLNKYEKGHRTPDADFIHQLVIITDCNPGWLLTGEGRAFGIDMGVEKQMVSEALAVYEAANPQLTALIKKIEVIYNDGSPSQRAIVRGTVEETYDEVIKNKNKEDLNIGGVR